MQLAACLAGWRTDRPDPAVCEVSPPQPEQDLGGRDAKMPRRKQSNPQPVKCEFSSCCFSMCLIFWAIPAFYKPLIIAAALRRRSFSTLINRFRRFLRKALLRKQPCEKLLNWSNILALQARSLPHYLSEGKTARDTMSFKYFVCYLILNVLAQDFPLPHFFPPTWRPPYAFLSFLSFLSFTADLFLLSLYFLHARPDFMC